MSSPESNTETVTRVRERADAALLAARGAGRAARLAGRASAARAVAAVNGADLPGLARAGWEWLRSLIQRTGLTDFGVSVVLLALACLIAGAALGWRELTLIGVGGIAIIAVCVLYTLAHADVTATLHLSSRRLRVVDETMAAVVTVHVTNASENRTLLPLKVSARCGDEPWTPGTRRLKPGETDVLTHRVLARRRGVMKIGPVNSVRADPLGLFRHEKEVAPEQELIVHPRIVQLDQLGSGLLRDLEGEPTRTIVSHDLEFHALREYVPGDDRRHIHWRTSERLGKLMVRQFVDTRSSHLAVVVSGARNEYADDAEFEAALEVGASIASRAMRDDQAVSVIAAGHTGVRSAGSRLLDAFARAELGSSRSRALRPLVQHRVGRLSGVTVGILIAGSKLEPRAFLHAGEPLAAQVKLVGIRVGAEGRSGPMGELTLLNVAKPKDLARVLRALG